MKGILRARCRLSMVLVDVLSARANSRRFRRAGSSAAVESGHRQFEEREPLNRQIVTLKANLEKPSKLDAVIE